MSDDTTQMAEAIRDLSWVLGVLVQHMCAEIHPIDLEKARKVLERIDEEFAP